MVRYIESAHAWIESTAYQMQTMHKQESNLKLGGTTALLKVHCTKIFEYCAREAAQIFGGLGYTRGGQGEKVERLSREVRAMAVPGGSEEVMLDLGVRQSRKITEMAKQILGAKRSCSCAHVDFFIYGDATCWNSDCQVVLSLERSASSSLH